MVLEIDAPVGNNPSNDTRVEPCTMVGVSLLAFQANICLETEKSVYNMSVAQLAIRQNLKIV